jgi:hypothetical protein
MSQRDAVRSEAEILSHADDLQWLFAEPARVPIADAAADERQRQLRDMQRSFLRGRTS